MSIRIRAMIAKIRFIVILSEGVTPSDALA